VSWLLIGLTLLTFGVSLLDLALSSDSRGPSHYDGDGDDAGIVSERVTGVRPVDVVQAVRPFLAPPLVAHPSAQRGGHVAPSVPPPARLVPRAPPAA
jgi:hypothetical protein